MTISLVLSIPAGFANSLTFDASVLSPTNQTTPRAKICSVLFERIGENLPCERCSTDSATSMQVTPSFHDGFSWTGSLSHFNVRNATEKADVDEIECVTNLQIWFVLIYFLYHRLSIVVQILPHLSNVQGASLTVLAGILCGDEQLSLLYWNVLIDSPPVNETASHFDMKISIADDMTNVADILAPRKVFLDIYTNPGDVFTVMDIDVTMPQTTTSSKPVMTICAVNVTFTGKYASCAQKELMNDPSSNRITYLDRHVLNMNFC